MRSCEFTLERWGESNGQWNVAVGLGRDVGVKMYNWESHS